MIETLERLPGEGNIATIKRIRRRKVCENCGEPAHFKHTFLVPNGRTNPASNAYGRDDCSRCQDAEQFSCNNPACKRELSRKDNYNWCATFPAIEGYAHMFLYWDPA